MWNKNNCSSWGFLVLILIFNLVYARPRTSSSENVKTQNNKNETIEHKYYKDAKLRNDEKFNNHSDNGSKKSIKDNSSTDNKDLMSNTSDNDKTSKRGRITPRVLDIRSKVVTGDDSASRDSELKVDSSETKIEDDSAIDNGNYEDTSEYEDDDAEESPDKENGASENDNDSENPSSQESDEADEFVKRPLKVGDLFTPNELLPVTVKLMGKLEMPPGEGRGIVSSSKSAEDMADRIFAAYFLTMKRIVILKNDDIAGLDALQALAIEGEPANYKYFDRTVTKVPPIMLRRSDQIFAWTINRRSHYNLITKRVSRIRLERNIKNAKDRRRKIKLRLENKLARNRQLVINSPPSTTPGKHKGAMLKKKRMNGTRFLRLKNKKTNTKKKKVQRRMKNSRRNLKTDLHSGCTWRYECTRPDDLDTCDLIAKCLNGTVQNGTMEDVPEAQKQANNIELSNLSFRRLLGLTLLDEQVEKIIENHVVIVKPENMHPKSERIESLNEYFNNIIIIQNSQSTTPIPKTVMKDKQSSEDEGGEVEIETKEKKEEKRRSGITKGFRDITQRKVSPIIVKLDGRR